MKRLLLLLMVMLSSCVVEAQNILYFPHDSTWIDLEGGLKNKLSFVTSDDIAYVIVDDIYVYLGGIATSTDLKKYINSLVSSATLETDTSNGYRFFMNNTKGPSSSKQFRTYVLSGGDVFLIAHHSYNIYDKLAFFGFITDTTVKASMEEGKELRQGIWIDDLFANYIYLDSGIASITASSYLTETVGDITVDYRPEYMMNRICKVADGGGYPEFDNFMRCWAEGVAGDGIGEWLKVDFTRASDEMMILNGYIDFGNMQAYKRNNRLKRIKVESIEPAFSMEYAFEDYVAYHTIKLPAATKSVKITILDVYKGAKYSDTCVTAIALPQERWRTKEAEDKEVRAYLQKLGVLDYVKAFKREQE